MKRLSPDKLHTRFLAGAAVSEMRLPRRYTLTHSDATGDLYLTIGQDYDHQQCSGWYTRLMRDEVLAEWQTERDSYTLHVHCHVSGELVFGSAAMRDAILKREMPLVLEALRFGDSALFAACPELDVAPVKIHFHAAQACYDRVETWGALSRYR